MIPEMFLNCFPSENKENNLTSYRTEELKGLRGGVG
jgi:hypothetical protein